jgi:hypothetical protein
MYTGPHIIKDGLVFGYDTGYGIADNVTGTRFYPGKPGTNLVTGQATAFNNWSGLTGTSTYYTTAEGNQGVHLITTSGGGVQFYSSPTIYGISASTQYTISATIKYSGTTPHPNLFYVRQYHNGSQITEGGQFSTGLMVDLGNGWYRAYRTFTTTSTTSYINLQGYQYNSGVNLKIQDLQFELGGFLTPYNGVNGTRSSTASLIDLKETTDIDVSNVSFDSTGQLTFDGSDDRITIPAGSYETIGTNNFTIEAVCKNTKTSSYNHFFSVKDQYHFAFKASNTGTGILYVYRTSSLSTASTLPAYIPSRSEYYHIVCKREGDNLEIFVNGVSKGTKSGWNNISIDNNSWPSYIGWGNGSEYTGGDIPIVKVYNKALTATEVKQNYNAYKNRFDI